MNLKMLARYLGMAYKAMAGFLLLPLLVSLLGRECRAAAALLATLLFVAAVSLTLARCHEGHGDKPLHIKDGFAIVGLCWLGVCAAGALPFWLSGEIPFLIDAFFESASGFTTTGASILTEVEGMSRGLLLWRSLTHWIGGMGVLIFLMAVVPSLAGRERSVSVMWAESPGPAPAKLVPKLAGSAKILYLLYGGLTLLLFLLLLVGGMPLFDSLANALATAGTGGFAVRNASIAAYGSVYCEMVITVFMIVFSVNFNIYYFLLIRNLKGVRQNEELRAYMGIIVGSILLIALNITRTCYESFGQALRYASFQVASVISSTGFATADFDLWPMFSKSILFLLMFIGASAGSTGGGIKISRILILAREAKRVLYQVAQPRRVQNVTLDGKALDADLVHATNSYLFTFGVIYITTVLIVSLNGFDLETTFSAAVACLNNIGPGFGQAGPASSFAAFSPMSKLALSFAMLLGRLEFYPLLLLCTPSTWKK